MAYVRGGKNLFGFKIGVLMLESKFPRVPGDMGNACSFDFPVLYRVVTGRPVFDIRSLMWFMQSALARPEAEGFL